MCPLEIPHSFVPGQKAKANEVNANFNSIKTFVDANEVNIAENELEIVGLKENKADINGALENKFQVANPEGPYDAVNKQSLTELTANTKEFIGGFVLSKYDDATITSTPGDAWDSTYTYMFNQGTALQATQSNLSASATYYVYVTGGEDFTTELVISLSNEKPEGIEGTGKVYRKLGSFLTDSSSKISQVYSLTNSITLESTQKSFSYHCPDYSNIKTRAHNVSHTETQDGWIIYSVYCDNATATLNINGFNIQVGHENQKSGVTTSGLFPITAGTTWRLSGGGVNTLGFAPIKGV